MICKSTNSWQITNFNKSFILTMWYVNTKIDYLQNAYGIAFILTMWYVNDLNNVTTGSMYMSFILTMWYVNWMKCWKSLKK